MNNMTNQNKNAIFPHWLKIVIAVGFVFASFLAGSLTGYLGGYGECLDSIMDERDFLNKYTPHF